MQYGVPQFIDVEDKIVGPFTAKQTLYLIIGGGFLMLIFSFFDLLFFAIVALIIIPITLAFAFWKPKGMTIARLITNYINYQTSNHLYVWRREPDSIMFKAAQKKSMASAGEPEKKISRSRISDLAWVLDTSTTVNLPYEATTRPEERVI